MVSDFTSAAEGFFGREEVSTENTEKEIPKHEHREWQGSLSRRS